MVHLVHKSATVRVLRLEPQSTLLVHIHAHKLALACAYSDVRRVIRLARYVGLHVRITL